MALFGGFKNPLKGSTEPGGLGGDEKLMILGAMLSDLGNGGRGPQTTLALSDMLKEKRKDAAKAQALKALSDTLGPQYAVDNTPIVQRTERAPVPELNEINMPGLSPRPEAPAPYTYQPPQRLPQRTLNDPQVQQALMAASLGGVPGVGDIVSLLDKTRPDMDFVNGVAVDKRAVQPGERVGVNLNSVNGFMVDQQDPANAGRYYGEAPAKGAQPVYDQHGRQAGWTMMDGSLQAIQAAAAAEAGGRARYNTVQATDALGRPVTTTADRIAGQPITGQSPAQGVAARAEAEAAAQARIGLGGTVQQANEALELINTIRNHEALGARTGLTGSLPAIPGTPGADFDAMADQLKGKVFLEAFQSLKGAGAITEQEGKAATVAIARLNRAQTRDGYLAGLSDLEKVIRSGVARAQQKAGASGRRTAAAPDRAAVEAELRRRGLIQ